MENIKPKEEVVESTTPAPEEEGATQEPVVEETPKEEVQEPSSSTEEEDLSSLIDEEKKHGVPDPDKAKARFEKTFHPPVEEPVVEDFNEGDQPVTRAELDGILAKNTQQVILNSQQTEITNIAGDLAETDDEAELIRAIHSNRVYPANMPLREQLGEAHAVATIKREQAKNGELARKIRSQNSVSRNTATTHRDPQASLEPDMAPDLKASMTRAGYTFNSTQKRYEKTLPNGNILVKEKDKSPYMVEA